MELLIKKKKKNRYKGSCDYNFLIQKLVTCNGYGITFDSAGSLSLDNGTARNVIIFGVDNSSSSHDENRKNNFLVLGEGPTLVLTEALVYQR